MLNKITEFFEHADRNIAIGDIMNKTAYSIPSVGFKYENEIVEITIELPANSVAPYTYYEFAENMFIEHIYNGTIGKLHEVGDVLITTPLSATESTTLSEDIASVIIAQYGMGYLLENSDEASTIILRVARVDRSSQYLNLDISNTLMLMYYYLYVKQPEDLYKYSRMLSSYKANVISENKKVVQPLRIHRHVIKPMGL